MTLENFNFHSCPEGKLYETLREIDCAVIAQARHFSLNTDGLDAYVASLPRLPETALLSETDHLIDPDDPEGTLNYLFALESVNFGGPYARHLKAEGFVPEDGSLYRTVARRLKSFFARNGNGALKAPQMAALSLAEVREIFAFPSQAELRSRPVSARLAQMFTESLRDTGAFVMKRCAGNFRRLPEESGGSVERFVRMMWALPKFRDVHSYPLRHSGKTLEVPVLKRAQHVAGSLHLAMTRMGMPAPFRDPDRLTAFPDNKISHVMMVEGFLVPEPETRRRIESGQTFSVGAPAEIENRVCGRHLIRLMSERSGIPQLTLDHWTWEHSHDKAFSTGRPYRDTPHLMTDAPSFNY